MSFTYQQPRAADFILSEANGNRSRENVIISAGSGILKAGTLIAMLTAANAGTATANVGNTGNGLMGAVTVSSAAITGSYKVEITSAAANGGSFSVTDPNGVLVGTGEVTQPFDKGGIAFTIADGAADFVVGDGWTIAVQAGLGEYVPYDNAGANDGRRVAGGILYAPVDATHTDVQAVSIARDAEVAAELLIGLDADGRADLEALGIIVRG